MSKPPSTFNLGRRFLHLLAWFLSWLLRLLHPRRCGDVRWPRHSTHRSSVLSKERSDEGHLRRHHLDRHAVRPELRRHPVRADRSAQGLVLLQDMVFHRPRALGRARCDIEWRKYQVVVDDEENNSRRITGAHRDEEIKLE